MCSFEKLKNGRINVVLSSTFYERHFSSLLSEPALYSFIRR